MKCYPPKKPLTFGEFVAGSYRAWGKHKANEIIRLAIKTQMLEFRGPQRYEIS